MPERCVVYGCSNTTDSSDTLCNYRIPFWGDEAPIAAKRKMKWVNFVRRKRDKWTPSRSSVVCSKHFTEDCFEFGSTTVPKFKTPKLKRDEHGVIVFPTLESRVEEKPDSERTLRYKRKNTLSVSDAEAEVIEDTEEATQEDTEEFIQEVTEEAVEEAIEEAMLVEEEAIPVEPETMSALKRRNHQLKNLWLTSKQKLCDARKKLGVLEREKEGECSSKTLEEGSIDSYDDMSSDEQDYDAFSDVDVETETDETTDSEANEDSNVHPQKIAIKEYNVRAEPKFIVFLTQLLTLFKICPSCKCEKTLVDVNTHGTMAEVITTCVNPDCGKRSTWFSQPNFPGTKIAAGNLLLSFGIIVAGTSATKVFRVLQHMGMKCVSLRTYFKYQREKLFPSIYINWIKYQARLLEEVKRHGEVVIAGDGRHDSMGHSAKFCAYTVFCCTLPFIIHFVLVQRNEVGNSPAMEYAAFARSMEYLLGLGLVFKTFVSDRHTSIAKHMRERLPTINHYFDIWHLKKKITKVLTALSKVSGCEAIAEWIKPCTNHLYWSAKTTVIGGGEVIWAKFASFLGHVVDKHENLENPVFDKCHHGETIEPRKWLDEDSIAYEKMCSSLTNANLVKGIKQASPIAQTSCLEGFHSVLNQFSPKMIGYTYRGMFCRHALAVIHFNKNLLRSPRMKDGVEQINVVYPKFMNGVAVIRKVAVKQNFDYVEDIFQTLVSSIINNKLEDAVEKLQTSTPPHMNTMLAKQSREEAIKKKKFRDSMELVDVPPTNPVPTVEVSTQQGEGTSKTRRCRTCKHPMRGHATVLDCPRNKRN